MTRFAIHRFAIPIDLSSHYVEQHHVTVDPVRRVSINGDKLEWWQCVDLDSEIVTRSYMAIATGEEYDHGVVLGTSDRVNGLVFHLLALP